MEEREREVELKFDAMEALERRKFGDFDEYENL
jgi:hypothetical protein